MGFIRSERLQIECPSRQEHRRIEIQSSLDMGVLL